jgi:hypothetical protein
LYYYKRLTYEEALAPDGKDYMQLNSYLWQRGSGFSATLGAICQPLAWLRVGLSVQSPLIGSLTTRTNALMGNYGDTKYEKETRVFSERNRLTLPLRTTTGMTFLFGRRGLVSVQYDYRHIKTLQDVHTLKVGGEIVPTNNLFLNLGYACESSFRKEGKTILLAANDVRTDGDFRHWLTGHYASAGIGYRGRDFVAHVAYQFGYKGSVLYPFAVSDSGYSPDGIGMKTMTHRIVLTLGWHTR